LDQPDLPRERAPALVTALIDMDRVRAWARRRTTPGAIADPERRSLALELAEALLEGPVDEVWELISDVTAADDDAGKLLLGVFARERGTALAARLTPARLGELFRLLLEYFPPEPLPSRGYGVTPELDASMWRSAVLSQLVREATPEAISALEELENELGSAPAIRRLRHQAAEQLRRTTWSPPDPAEIVRLGQERDKRYVSDAATLKRILLDALEDIAAELRGALGLSLQLWNTAPHRIPKSENEISNVLAHWLRARLAGHRAVINREVEINPAPGGASGDRTDILVQAAGRDDIVTVVVEVKGAWNEQLLPSIETQLADRYLKPTFTDYGIYLVAWFSADRWEPYDSNQLSRRARATRSTAPDLLALLEGEAKRVSGAAGVEIDAFVVDGSL
jgi:hypothetical protein